MFFSAAAFGLVLASSVAGKVWNINVGDSNGDTKFDPEAIVWHCAALSEFHSLTSPPCFQFADVGDQVIFTFHQKNHTATRSSFAAPCSPMEGGFDSGL